MHNKDKHNIFSKEEFFKLIDEKKSLPPDADDFDKEALEGLSLMKDRSKLDKLDASIDEVLKHEKAKASRKRNIYYFSAAASLLLIVGLFFLVKETTLKKENLAQNNEVVETRASSSDKKLPTATAPAGETISSSEKAPAEEKPIARAEQKESMALESKLAEESKKTESFAADVTTVKEEPVDQLSKPGAVAANENALSGMSGGMGNAAGGKTVNNESKADKDLANNRKNADDKPTEKKVLYKGKEGDEKDKSRVVTNTVWVTDSKTSGKDEEKVKQQQAQTESMPAPMADTRSAPKTSVSTNVAQPVQTGEDEQSVAMQEKESANKSNGPAKKAEVAQYDSEKVSSGKSKRHKKAKSKSAQMNSAADNSGYAYYSQSGTRDFSSPQFMGGESSLQQFIQQNLKVNAPDKKGTITVEFTVKKDGAIDTIGIKVISPIKDCSACSKDVVDLIKKMPKWQPASENGEGKEYRQKLSVSYNSAATKK